MPNARQVKQRIGTANNIAKITKAMEMVSASKMRRAQDQTLAARPFAQALQESLQKLAHEAHPDLHPLLSKHESGQDVAIVVSTDKGLCGSLNQNLFKALLDWNKKHPNGTVIVIGKKGVTFTRFLALPVAAQFIDLPDPIKLADVLPITSLVMQNFTEKLYKSVTIIYMDFINTLSQKTKVQQILPLDAQPVEDTSLVEQAHEYLFEPAPKEILSELLPYFVENSVYQAFLESKASEHSARMVAMKNASDNAKDLVKELKLIYNKSRQESITSELLDITTAQLSLTA